MGCRPKKEVMKCERNTKKGTFISSNLNKMAWGSSYMYMYTSVSIIPIIAMIYENSHANWYKMKIPKQAKY